MKNYKLLVIAGFFSPVFLLACGSTSGGQGADIAGQKVAKQSLTTDDLANTSYRIDRLGEFRLDKGEFNRQFGEGMTQKHKVNLEKVAFGDLDHDGLEDAAVILASQSGGSGTFKYLMAMRNTGNVPQQLDSILLGDRVQISALSIADGQVRLEKLQAGPGDPACCPSQRVQEAYRLRDGRWSESADRIADSNATITGIVWKWERYEDTSESRHFVIDDPGKYTLI